jgi:hypothetical protein
MPKIADINAAMTKIGISPEKFAQVKEAFKSQRNLKRRIPFGDQKLLATVISKHGIKHIPELGSIPSARQWINKKIEVAEDRGDENEANKWADMMVDYQDFDNDPSTIDNVVMYRQSNPADVYAVDGYRLATRDNDLVQRGYYGTFPTREERSANKLSPQYRAYQKKYPTEELRAKYKYNEKFVEYYEDKVPLFRKIHEYVIAVGKANGFKTRADDNDVDSQTVITNKKYTTVIGKTTGVIYNTRVLPMLAKLSLYSKTSGVDLRKTRIS